MKPIFKSIYTKFALIFLFIWWFLNSLTFSVISKVLSNHLLPKMSSEVIYEFHSVRNFIGLTFLMSAMIGTIIILIAIRSIVKPITRLSQASKEVAKGNFDIQVKTKSTDEIGRLTADFNLMSQELKNIDLLRKDFVANVSHEFKTPITSIKGFAKIIRSGNLSNDQLIEYSQIIVDESERLSLLSSNLLKISELDSKIIREQGSAFSLDEQIRKAILILESQWAKKNIDLDINLEKISYIGDKHLLQQVWLNLIQNAIKFSNENGTIRIHLQKNETIKIQITDYGIGIPKEDKQHIFERFYKGDKSRSTEGNGLGLVIVKKIIDLSNGKIHFESEVGKGSTFIVELPLRYNP